MTRAAKDQNNTSPQFLGPEGAGQKDTDRPRGKCWPVTLSHTLLQPSHVPLGSDGLNVLKL